jgi:hypothetical protein
MNSAVGTFLRILASTNTKPQNTTSIGIDDVIDDTTYIEEFASKERHEEYLWLLIVDLLIFIGLTATTYLSSKKLAQAATNPDDFRPKFIRGLVWANGGKEFLFYLQF